MSEYKDRGIMKWAPFDALNGHSSMLEELIYSINKKQKAILSEETYSDIDKIIKKAISENKEVVIDYYYDGYTYTTYGRINKIDEINKIIHLCTNESISFESIIDARF